MLIVDGVEIPLTVEKAGLTDEYVAMDEDQRATLTKPVVVEDEPDDEPADDTDDTVEVTEDE